VTGHSPAVNRTDFVDAFLTEQCLRMTNIALEGRRLN